MTASRSLCLLLAAAGIVASCGGDDGADEPGRGPSTGDERASTSSSDLSPDRPPTLGAPAHPPTTPTEGFGGTRTVTGTVTEVAGCVVLDAGGVRWALEGDLPEVAPGTEITVTGRPTGRVADACGDAILRVTGVDAG